MGARPPELLHHEVVVKRQPPQCETHNAEQDDKGGCGNLQGTWLKLRCPVRGAQTKIRLNTLLIFQQLFRFVCHVLQATPV